MILLMNAHLNANNYTHLKANYNIKFIYKHIRQTHNVPKEKKILKISFYISHRYITNTIHIFYNVCNEISLYDIVLQMILFIFISSLLYANNCIYYFLSFSISQIFSFHIFFIYPFLLSQHSSF